MSGPLRVAIVGAGASGTLLAIHLLRQRAAPVAISLIERSGVFGRGVAYGATNPDHTLNVPAHLMGGVDQDDADGFVRWSAPAAAGDELARLRLAYPARGAYGDYLQHLLHRARADSAAANRCDLLAAEAVRVEPIASQAGAPAFRVQFADAPALEADRVVLCLGNLPPPRLGAQDAARVIEDPWLPGAFDVACAAARVVIVGTGLSMVDAVLDLERAGFSGTIVALSRHGCLPVADAPVVPYPDFLAPGLAHLGIREVTRALRAEIRTAAARGIGWHSVIEAFRVHAGAIWIDLDERNRRRFLRHLRSPWLVVRHRLPPRHMRTLQAMIGAGRLQVRAARVLGVEDAASGCTVRILPRGAIRAETLATDVLINCTGPQSDFRRVRMPLLASLIETGQVRPDAYGLGLAVSDDLAAIGADGTPSDGLFVVGSHTRGRFWEVTAVPHIRRQVEDLTRHLVGRSGYC